jgi:hypothetical protein
MKRLASFTAAILLVALPLATVPAPAQAMSDDERAALAIILALGIGVAARHGGSHDSTTDWDEGLYGKPFSPSDGIVCLPKPRQCYADGNLSQRWTQRIFGS